MKAYIFQPPYSKDPLLADEHFCYKMKLLDECGEDADIIVLPEYSDALGMRSISFTLTVSGSTIRTSAFSIPGTSFSRRLRISDGEISNILVPGLRPMRF